MTLPDLIKRLEAFEPTGCYDDQVSLPNAIEDCLGWATLGYDAQALFHSLDAVAALTKERLPVAEFFESHRFVGEDWICDIGVDGTVYHAAAKTEACARLIALLRAMDAENEG